MRSFDVLLRAKSPPLASHGEPDLSNLEIIWFAASVCCNGESCSRSNFATNFARANHERTKRSHGARSEQDPREKWEAILARGIIRSLGTERAGVWTNQKLHRVESSDGGAREEAGGLGLVECFTEMIRVRGRKAKAHSQEWLCYERPMRIRARFAGAEGVG